MLRRNPNDFSCFHIFSYHRSRLRRQQEVEAARFRRQDEVGAKILGHGPGPFAGGCRRRRQQAAAREEGGKSRSGSAVRWREFEVDFLKSLAR